MSKTSELDWRRQLKGHPFYLELQQMVDDASTALGQFESGSVPTNSSAVFSALKSVGIACLDGDKLDSAIREDLGPRRTLGFQSAVFRLARLNTLQSGPGTNTAIAEALYEMSQSLRQLIAESETRALELRVRERTVSTAPEFEDRGTSTSRKVFIVHGHDGEAREAVARFLEKVDIEAIILHERASQGRTIIEKIEDHGDVGFAVVLLTPDDEGRANGGTLHPRARQNVMLELGYFMGRLGRKKVCALKRGDVELPSDFAGSVWVSMDDGPGWKLSLARELDAAGIDIDLNKALH